jgi:hypothetical protein
MKKLNYQVYCDLDGVLVDFEKGIVTTGNFLVNNTKDLEPSIKNNKTFLKLLGAVLRRSDDKPCQYTFEDFQRRTKGDRAFRDLLYWYIASHKDWWINLEWIHNGKVLWDSIQKYNPIILSSPVGPISEKGKRIWCKNNLGLDKKRVIIVDDKGIEWNYKKPLLIDDREKSIAQIEKVGGIGILYHPNNLEQSLKNLEDVIDIIKGQ